MLALGRRALVIIGTTHVRKSGLRIDSMAPAPERESVGEALARRHPGSAYVIETVIGMSNPELGELVSDAQPNRVVPVAGTELKPVIPASSSGGTSLSFESSTAGGFPFQCRSNECRRWARSWTHFCIWGDVPTKSCRARTCI